METTPNPTYPRCPYSKAGRRESPNAIGEAVIGLSANPSPHRCKLGYHLHQDITTVSRLAEYQAKIGLKTEEVTKPRPTLTTRKTPIGSLAEQGRKEMEAHKKAGSVIRSQLEGNIDAALDILIDSARPTESDKLFSTLMLYAAIRYRTYQEASSH